MKLTTEQARERIDEVKEIIKAKHMCESMDGECSKEDVQDYRERFEALQMGADALEKQEPKKLLQMSGFRFGYKSDDKSVECLGFCENCSYPIFDKNVKYCYHCGQKIDFSEESDN